MQSCEGKEGRRNEGGSVRAVCVAPSREQAAGVQMGSPQMEG